MRQMRLIPDFTFPLTMDLLACIGGDRLEGVATDAAVLGAANTAMLNRS